MIKHASSVLLLAALAPVSLGAQARTTFSTYVAADGGVSGGPTVVGGAIGAEAGPVAIRLGGAVDPRLGAPDLDASGPTGLWSAEADGILYLGRSGGLIPYTPYLVVGAGMRSLGGVDSAPIAGMLSYGAGARVPVIGGLALEAEGRYRHPLSGPELVPEGISSGFEVRVGLSYRAPKARFDTRPVPAPGIPLSRPLYAPRSADAEAAYRLATARRAIDAGGSYLGVRYRWGGNTPDTGFDCSGFIRYVYRQQGIELPRVSRDQARAGTPLPLDLSVLEPGDLMAFASNGREVDHIAIYAGDGRILHSSSSGGGVRYDDLHSQRGSWYVRHWVAARRVIAPSPLAAH